MRIDSESDVTITKPVAARKSRPDVACACVKREAG